MAYTIGKYSKLPGVLKLDHVAGYLLNSDWFFFEGCAQAIDLIRILQSEIAWEQYFIDHPTGGL